MRFQIYRYVRTKKGWRYCPAVLDKGMPVTNLVMVDGAHEVHAEGNYYLRHGRQWIKAGKTPQDVIDATLRLSQPEAATPEPLALWQQMARFEEHYGVGKSEKTRHAMHLVLKNFLACVQGKASCAQDVTKEDVAWYWQWEVDHSPTHSLRTAHNRIETLNRFLKEHGVEVIGRGKGKWAIPQYDEEVPEIYSPAEIEALMAHSDQRRRAAYSAMLKALLREKEAVYLEWPDVNAPRSTVTVRSKPQWGWRVKKFHERTVKVPRELVALIVALPRTGPLVFGTEGGKPDLKLLRALKKIAVTAGIDPDRCWLHKLRATGCSILLQSGMPLPDVMAMGGWRDLESVQRYMGLLAEDRLEQAVEAAWA